MMKDKITLESLKSSFKKKGYTWDSKFNLIGIRTLDNTAGEFNDWMCIISDDKLVGVFECTTDPGIFYLENPTNVNGTAILPEGQHKSIWVIGKHKGYEALVQFGVLSVYRDKNKNTKIDIGGKLYNDVAGLNCHRGHETWTRSTLRYLGNVFKTIKVGKYSAGCQVIAYKDDFDNLLKYAKLSKKKIFDYTLLKESDFI